MKDWWNKLPTDWHGLNLRKITTWLVLGFVILVGFMLTQEAKADETTAEFAPTLFVGGQRYNGGLLLVEERFKGKYALGLGLTTTWECPNSDDCRQGEGKTNQFIYVQRVIQYKKFEVGIGVSYWHNTSPAWSSHTPFALHVGWNVTDHLNFKWRHFSTGGSSDRNNGLDLLVDIGWRF